LASFERSGCWDIRAPNSLTTDRQQLAAAEVLRLIRGLPLQRQSQASLARRYNVEFRTIEAPLPGQIYVVLRADPRRFAFYVWSYDLPPRYFSPYEFGTDGYSPFWCNATNALEITEESHPGLPRLEWKHLSSWGSAAIFYLVEVLDTAV
jgi:hypothetical protein